MLAIDLLEKGSGADFVDGEETGVGQLVVKGKRRVVDYTGDADDTYGLVLEGGWLGEKSWKRMGKDRDLRCTYVIKDFGGSFRQLSLGFSAGNDGSSA